MRRGLIVERQQRLLLQAVPGAVSAREEHHHEEARETQAEENGDGENFHEGRWLTMACVTIASRKPRSPRILP